MLNCPRTPNASDGTHTNLQLCVWEFVAFLRVGEWEALCKALWVKAQYIVQGSPHVRHTCFPSTVKKNINKNILNIDCESLKTNINCFRFSGSCWWSLQPLLTWKRLWGSQIHTSEFRQKCRYIKALKGMSGASKRQESSHRSWSATCLRSPLTVILCKKKTSVL